MDSENDKLSDDIIQQYQLSNQQKNKIKLGNQKNKQSLNVNSKNYKEKNIDQDADKFQIKRGLQIINYDLDDQDDQQDKPIKSKTYDGKNKDFQTQNHELQSHSYKSDQCENYTNNSKNEKQQESFAQVSEDYIKSQNDQELLFIDDQDKQDFEFLEELNNENATQELSNLYTSCLEWILNKPVSSLGSQLLIDDDDKIQYPEALELLMNLVSQSNDLLKQRALLDFYMLCKWDRHNGHILLFHQKFHYWLLDLLLSYQHFIEDQDENCRAVYDMGCKLHTLLLTNSCINPEDEAFKKLNIISRYPLTVQENKRIVAEKLSRVLLINLMNSLNIHLQNFKEINEYKHNQNKKQAEEMSERKKEIMCGWINFAHIIQVSEEMIFSSNKLLKQKMQNQNESEDEEQGLPTNNIQQQLKTIQQFNKNQKAINLNLSQLDWLKTQNYLLYFQQEQDSACEKQWAEWELIDQIMQTFDILLMKIGIIEDDSQYQASENGGILTSQQTYQISTQIIQENVFQKLERFYQTNLFEQDIQILMREILSGNKIANIQNIQNKFSFPIGAGRLKNLKLQFQPQSQSAQSSTISQQQQLLLQNQKQHCMIDSVLNILCTAIIQAENKENTQKWLQKFENFLRYIMLLSETISQNQNHKGLLPISKVQQKFSNIITFGLAFLFHQINSSNFRQMQGQIQQHDQPNTNQISISVCNNNKLTTKSNNSKSSQSPKDYQAINKMYAHSLKNTIIFFVNIIDYKDLLQNTESNKLSNIFGQQSHKSQSSAVSHIFNKILINKFSDQQTSQLITLEDIKRYKATNFEDFPECFSNELWKVAFFHSDEINQILRSQINQNLIEQQFILRRKTYTKGFNEMSSRFIKTKDEIQKRIQIDTLEKISHLSQKDFEQKLKHKINIYVQILAQQQSFSKLMDPLFVNKGFWKCYGQQYLKSTNKGFCGIGIKALMKERPVNGFDLIHNQALEKKLFKLIDRPFSLKNSIQELQFTESNNTLFSYFSKRFSPQKENYELYIDMVKQNLSQKFMSQKLLHQSECSILKQFYQIKGAILITSEEIIFINSCNQSQKSLQSNDTISDIYNIDDLFFFKKSKNQKLYKIIDLENIKELQRRRFVGFKNCIEIFFVDNSSYLLKFNSTNDRESFAKKLLKLRSGKCKNLRYYDSLDPKKIIKRREIVDRWRQWRISNFQYLVTLNYYGGRSNHDLSQYPVFPWILSDYSEEKTANALTYQQIKQIFNQVYQRGDAPPIIFRDLSKNMQLLGSAERQAELKKKYEDNDGFSDMQDRFHCGSHYSNPGIVLHYMARISPYIDSLVELQGMNHDNPDRIFHSLKESYQNALSDHADVREITTEFFYLPELFLNKNNINFGKRQDNQNVEDVILPYWSNKNPYRFIVLMREAIESNYVSQNISKWIDYIFGYKQQGVDAERCLNTYSIVTYEDRVDLIQLSEVDPSLAESYKLQMYNYGQTPSNLINFKMKEHPQKKFRDEVFKFNLVSDNSVNLKVYRPVNNRQNVQLNSKAIISQLLNQGKLPTIQNKAIIKAQFINEGLIAAARQDGKLRFYLWVNQANELNPSTPFTCGKEKKKFYSYSFSDKLLINDINNIQLNKPFIILNRGSLIISGGNWDGQLCVSRVQDIPQNQSQNQQSKMNQNQQNDHTQQQIHLIETIIPAHEMTCTVIASTIDDPNKILSKNIQNQSSYNLLNDACIVITGSLAGDVVVWSFSPTYSNQNPLKKLKHFYDHDENVTSIFIHQDMQYFATSSKDGSANLYNLSRIVLVRTFKHPILNPISSVILSNCPLVCLAMFSSIDNIWQSFSINGQNLNELDVKDQTLTQEEQIQLKNNYYEECSHIVAPKVIQNSQFQEKLIYGTEKGYIVIRDLPFMAIIKRINISTNNLIQPVLTFIVSKDRRFLLVGCGEGGLTVVTEPFSNLSAVKTNSQIQIKPVQIIQTHPSNLISKNNKQLLNENIIRGKQNIIIDQNQVQIGQTNINIQGRQKADSNINVQRLIQSKKDDDGSSFISNMQSSIDQSMSNSQKKSSKFFDDDSYHTTEQEDAISQAFHTENKKQIQKKLNSFRKVVIQGQNLLVNQDIESEVKSHNLDFIKQTKRNDQIGKSQDNVKQVMTKRSIKQDRQSFVVQNQDNLALVIQGSRSMLTSVMSNSGGEETNSQIKASNNLAIINKKKEIFMAYGASENYSSKNTKKQKFSSQPNKKQ